MSNPWTRFLGKHREDIPTEQVAKDLGIHYDAERTRTALSIKPEDRTSASQVTVLEGIVFEFYQTIVKQNRDHADLQESHLKLVNDNANLKHRVKEMESLLQNQLNAAEVARALEDTKKHRKFPRSWMGGSNV